jgi:RNA-directed DNA polymerase
LLANIALSALDKHFDRQRRQYMGNDRQRAKRRKHGQGNWKIIRYADLCRRLICGPESSVRDGG